MTRLAGGVGAGPSSPPASWGTLWNPSDLWTLGGVLVHCPSALLQTFLPLGEERRPVLRTQRPPHLDPYLQTQNPSRDPSSDPASSTQGIFSLAAPSSFLTLRLQSPRFTGLPGLS